MLWIHHTSGIICSQYKALKGLALGLVSWSLLGLACGTILHQKGRVCLEWWRYMCALAIHGDDLHMKRYLCHFQRVRHVQKPGNCVHSKCAQVWFGDVWCESSGGLLSHFDWFITCSSLLKHSKEAWATSELTYWKSLAPSHSSSLPA